MADTPRERLDKRLAALDKERSSFVEHWRLLSEFVRPRRGRFETTDRNRGDRRHQSIINSRATKALQVATAGMFNGTMSPSRPWVVLECDDPEMREWRPARDWFYAVQEKMLRILNGTNLYNMAPAMVGEQLLFGTGCISHEDDAKQVARFYAHTIGSYYMAQNERGEIDVVARKFEMTVEQIVQRFSVAGEVSPSISYAVREAYDKGNYDAWYPVVHFVEPNPEYVPDSMRPGRRRYRSTYYEHGQKEKNQLLAVRGYDEFPFYCPRWEVTGEDIYATSCPGMAALGDVRQLQMQERKKGQAIDKMVTPPLQGPSTLKNVPIGNLPGNVTVFDSSGTGKGLSPLYEVRLPINELMLDMQAVEARINEAFYVDLFKAISAMTGIQPRNQLELMQRDQERLLELGPVLERQYGAFLNPLIDRVFNQMVKAGLVPPAPKELQGRSLKPRYVGSLALAQQAVTLGNIDRLSGFVGNLARAFPEIGDKFNPDQAVDEYSFLLGTPPELVRSDEEVAEIRRVRTQAQQAQQAVEIGQGAAKAMRDASAAEADGEMASKVMEALGGGDGGQGA
jgi:hypothetical protein